MWALCVGQTRTISPVGSLKRAPPTRARTPGWRIDVWRVWVHISQRCMRGEKLLRIRPRQCHQVEFECWVRRRGWCIPVEPKPKPRQRTILCRRELDRWQVWGCRQVQPRHSCHRDQGHCWWRQEEVPRLQILRRPAQVSKLMAIGEKLLPAGTERPEARNVPRKKGLRKYPRGRPLESTSRAAPTCWITWECAFSSCSVGRELRLFAVTTGAGNHRPGTETLKLRVSLGTFRGALLRPIVWKED